MDSSPRLTRRQIAWFLAFMVCYGWTGIDGNVVSPRIPFLVTDELHRSARDLARYGQIVSAAGAFSLLYGFLRDRWPWGDRRLLLVATPVSVLVPLFLFSGGVTYGRFLFCMVLSTVVAGPMAAALNATISKMGRRLGAVDRLVGLNAALGAALVAGGLEIGGALGRLPFSMTLLVVAFFGALLFLLLLRPAEGTFPPVERNVSEASVTPLRALGGLLRCRPYRVALFYSLVWNFSPVYGTPLTVRLKDVVGLSPQEFAHYSAIGTVVGVIGGLAFVALSVRLSPRSMLTWGPLVYLPMVFILFGMRTAADAYAMAAATNLVSSVLNAATFALILRTVPAGLEGTGVALSGTLGVLINGQGDVWGTGFSESHGFFPLVWMRIAFLLVLPFLGRLVPAFPPEGKPA